MYSSSQHLATRTALTTHEACRNLAARLDGTSVIRTLTVACFGWRALPHMQRQKARAHIIRRLPSDYAGHRVGPGSAVYAATKTAVRVISEGLRQEVKPWNLQRDDHLAGRRRDGVAEQYHRGGRCKGYRSVLRAVRDSRRFVRSCCGLRDQSAGRRGYQRNPFSADAAGTLIQTPVGSTDHDHVDAARLIVLCSGVLAAGLTGSARQDAAPLAPLVLPAGFQAEVFAEKVENARSMALGPQGTVFVGSQYAGKVHAVVDC